MCTVTYLPTPTGFILTSNRDEALIRKLAENPQTESIAGHQVLFPRDGEALGTWIATADNLRTVCLLNGAFKRHHRNPPYRKSRGLVVLDFFKTDSAKNFHKDYELHGIEPFTMVIVEGKELFEFRWDGVHKFFKALDPGVPHIHCSASLYPPEVITLRERWFSNWLKNREEFKIEDILSFHLFAGEGDERTQVRMSIMGIVQTVSITCVQSIDDQPAMYYSDLNGDKSFYFRAYSFNDTDLNMNQHAGITISVNPGK